MFRFWCYGEDILSKEENSSTYAGVPSSLANNTRRYGAGPHSYCIFY